MKIINIVGARPNFIKIAPLMKAYELFPEINPILVHTGQHHDVNMNKNIFEELEIPAPHYNLEVRGGSCSQQISKIMAKFEEVCKKEKPDLVLVVGDVNSTIACSLVAAHLNIRVVHIEAGLRSRDLSMPEEINRILTDQISDILFVTEPEAIKNLEKEGISPKKIHFVGNIMIDSLCQNIHKIKASDVLERYNLEKKEYGIVTIHRPSNVDNLDKLSSILQILNKLQQKIKVIFPIHPRTQKSIEKFNLEEKINSMQNLILTSPLGYVDFMKLVKNSKVILTDSGGIQEEATVLNIPCITLRGNTERPITIEKGTNTLTGINLEKVLFVLDQILQGIYKEGKIPELWDGKTAKRIVEILKNENNFKL